MTDQELIDLMRGAISSEGTLNRAYLSEHFNELPGLNTLYTMVVEQADRIAELEKERDHAWKMVAEADARLGQSLGGNLLDKRKLAKAVDALREIEADFCQTDAALKYAIHTVLAKLEK